MVVRRFAYCLSLAAAIVASQAQAAQVVGTAAINVVKPVKLTKLQDLDFGTVTLSELTATRTLRISQAGVVTCPAEVVCSGVPKAASFNVQGTNKLVVAITVLPFDLSNGSDLLRFTPDAPATIALTSSGVPGNDFGVGGSVPLTNAVVGGLYTGTVTVTADYQ